MPSGNGSGTGMDQDPAHRCHCGNLLVTAESLRSGNCFGCRSFELSQRYTAGGSGEGDGKDGGSGGNLHGGSR